MEKSASFLEMGTTEEAGKRQRMEGLYLFQGQQPKKSTVMAPAKIKCNSMYWAVRDTSFHSQTQNLAL